MLYHEYIWGIQGIASPFLTSALDRGERSISCPGFFPLPTLEGVENPWIGGWGGSRIGLDAVEKRKIPCPIPVVKPWLFIQLLYWLSYPSLENKLFVFKSVTTGAIYKLVFSYCHALFMKCVMQIVLGFPCISTEDDIVCLPSCWSSDSVCYLQRIKGKISKKMWEWVIGTI
jgi:hypothetical protein